MLPHLGVHRGCVHDRAARGQQHVAEQVRSQAGRGARKQVGRGGGDEHQVGLLPERDMRHLVNAVPGAGADGLAGQRLPGRRADEMKRIRSRHDADRVT